ncbi:MAG TPA: ParB/RepB/Spo0J family partition protein [Desulfobulbus sp.]|nr:ParB/RepB/Spo0J family partition protein [Desulfobulbus sp.]
MQQKDNLVIDTRLGTNNILAIIPHAGRNSKNTAVAPMMAFGRKLSEHLRCFTVINGKYKPSIVDMNDVRAIRKRKKITDGFLVRIREFKDEIHENNLIPLILIIQEGAEQQQADIVLGYGQGERGREDRPHRPTMAPSMLSKIRMSLEDNGFSTSIADTDSLLCGRESYCLNQLFRQKDYIDGFYDPTVRSLVVTIAPEKLTEEDCAGDTGRRFARALADHADSMSLVRRVAVSAIETSNPQDLRYIFRVHGDNPANDMIRESYIDELARSISANGLLHPLVLLQKNDGRYKILCGFRRFQAIRRLGRQWVEAKTFNEDDFTTEDFFNISLAENTKRRNLNPIEIGNFLESAGKELGLNNARLAEQFGESLAIGKPGSHVSQSTIHKYRKLYQLRERGESREMISDVINDKLRFSIAAEVLAPIKDPVDRDRLYLDIVKPLAPTRPQLIRIIKMLRSIHPRLNQAVSDPHVQKILEQAVHSSHRANSFIHGLRKAGEQQPEKSKQTFISTVDALRKEVFGAKANKQDFNITRSSKGRKKSLTLHIRLQEQSMEEVVTNLKQLLTDEYRLEELQKLLKESPAS